MAVGVVPHQPPQHRRVPLPKSPAWTETETLTQEKETLGFYVSSHPLERWKVWSDAFATCNSGVKELKQDARVIVAAMVQSVRAIVVRNGKSAGQKMAILTVEDTSGGLEAVLFTEAYAKYGHLALAEQVVFVGGADTSRGEPQIIVDRLVPIEGVPLDSGRVRLFVDERLLRQCRLAQSSRRDRAWLRILRHTNDRYRLAGLRRGKDGCRSRSGPALPDRGVHRHGRRVGHPRRGPHDARPAREMSL